jgi:hypothetical protein
MKTFTDYLVGDPVPFFHEFFDASKNTLHGDFPAPGTISVERENNLVTSDDKKKKSTFDIVFESQEGKLTTAEFRAKFRFVEDDKKSIYGQVTLSKEGGGPFGLGATPGVQIVSAKSNQALTLNLDRAVYQYADRTFAVHARHDFLGGGVPVRASVAACVCPRTFAGVAFEYDALRSGLRSSVAAVQHTTRSGNSIVTASLDGRWNPGVTVSHLLNDKVRLLANVLPWGKEDDRAIVCGVEYLAHDDHTLLLRADLLNRLLSLSAGFHVAGWRIGASATWSDNPSDRSFKGLAKPQFGFSFKA